MLIGVLCRTGLPQPDSAERDRAHDSFTLRASLPTIKLMRPLEIVLIAGLVVRLVAGRLDRLDGLRSSRILAGLLLALLAAHLLFEGMRLTVAPAYVAAALFAVWTVRQSAKEPPPRSVRSRLRTVVNWALTALAAALLAAPPWLLPIFALPAPGGPGPVGTFAFPLIDSTRQEIFGPQPGGPRALMVRVWYPAEPGGMQPLSPYTSVAALTHGVFPFPAALMNQIKYVKTHSRVAAPVRAGTDRLPVLLFSHGYTSYLEQNTVQMEELASRGYVVFAISHTQDASATVFPDGQVVGLDPAIPEMLKRVGSASAMFEQIAKLKSAATPEERRAAFVVLSKMNQPRIEESAPVWVADTRFLLDELERLGPSHPAAALTGRLDLDKVGLFGMSFGGSNAGEVCRQDRRCKAGANIDGQQYGPMLDEPLNKPFLILSSDSAYPVHVPIYEALRGPAYLIVLKGTQHLGLTDFPYLAPALLGRLTGTMSIERREELLNRYLVAFFDTYLLGKRNSLLNGPQPDWSDVDFRSNHR